jgi:hypothetical protein
MELRPELMPPRLDPSRVARLAKLAASLDGAQLGQWEEDLAEFNDLAGTAFSIHDFQGIYCGQEHEDWVRAILTRQSIKKAEAVTKTELAEVIRRAIPSNGHFGDHEAYMAIFDANVGRDGASALIFYPPDYDSRTNTWGGGRPISEYHPTPEQIVEWAMSAAGIIATDGRR